MLNENGVTKFVPNGWPDRPIGPAATRGVAVDAASTVYVADYHQ